jgi:hypothetical protein
MRFCANQLGGGAGYHAGEEFGMTWQTLPPDAYRRWLERLAIRYSGDGYTVEFLSHSAVKYIEHGRSITFSSEPLTRTLSDGKTHWVLTVHIHYPLRWDDPDGGEITDADKEQAILSRLETVLKAKGKYELTPHAR